MRRQTKAIIEYGLPGFINALLEAVEAGWEVDEDNPPAVYGFAYETHLTRSADITDEQRATRSEILAKARQAKADKAAQKPDTE